MNHFSMDCGSSQARNTCSRGAAKVYSSRSVISGEVVALDIEPARALLAETDITSRRNSAPGRVGLWILRTVNICANSCAIARQVCSVAKVSERSSTELRRFPPSARCAEPSTVRKARAVPIGLGRRRRQPCLTAMALVLGRKQRVPRAGHGGGAGCGGARGEVLLRVGYGAFSSYQPAWRMRSRMMAL